MKNSKLTKSIVAVVAIALAVLSGSTLAQEWTLEEDQLVEEPKPYSPYVDQYFPQQVFFGDCEQARDDTASSAVLPSVRPTTSSVRTPRCPRTSVRPRRVLHH